ncbi:hypothetical protein C9374_004062 [Naegleria lovaniensis]|uniref:Endonuclease/exonuclease/phosphatase domain-containing protein n=1 Tax=Naegleria lovaniensis TaxID=51637 RepID=A0AA88KP71_NAELO|nr:uncharacterized protein C9374_004062 [Naegleria lovaniensis]KAG2383391.1 hypothetical protein C9374_004062 [Naegleria lovaniensis]
MPSHKFHSVHTKDRKGKIISRFINNDVANNSTMNHPSNELQNVLLSPSFSIYSQNLLASYWTDLDRYGFVEAPHSENYEWSGRVKKFMRDFSMHRPDVICLQEVEISLFENDILNPLKLMGYNGMVQQKLGDFPVGVGCLYREEKFELVQVHERSSVIILVLKLKENGKLIYVASCHLLGDPLQPQVRVNQLRSLFKHLKSYQKGQEHALVLCGDFNAEPHSATYNLVVDGYLHAHVKENGVEATAIDTKHAFKLKSAYMEIDGEEPSFTLKTKNNALVTDYIFFSSNFLNVEKVMEVCEPNDVPYIMTTSHLPNSKYGSDHLALQAVFAFKDEKVGNDA